MRQKHEMKRSGGDANMMWHCRHSFSEVLGLKTGEQVVIVAIEVWGPISAPRRNDSLVQLKKVVGEAPTTAREGACAPRKGGAAGDHATRAPKTGHLCRDCYAHKTVNIAHPKTRSVVRIVLIHASHD